MIRSLLPLLLTAFLSSAACQNGQLPTGETTASESPAPTRWLGDIPVYENFAALAPLFHKQTDTTYVINFWATWCKPCVEELPYFEKLHAEFQGEKVRIILVSLDFPRQLESKLAPFIEKHNLQSEVMVLADVRQNEWIDQVDPQWSGAIPVTIIYKADQRRFVGEQFAGYEELAAIVKELL